MTNYNPGTPQPNDIPSQSQDDFLDNFFDVNSFFGADHIPFGNIVSNATSANPCVCTSENHGLTTGNTVHISHFGSLVNDLIELWSINGGPYTVTVIDPNTFSINADSSTQLPYLANSGAFVCTQFPYGFHKQITLPQVLKFPPGLMAPASSLYPQLRDDLAQLVYQNNKTDADQINLTNIPFIQNSTMNGKGFITPWGVRINMGNVAYTPAGTGYTFPIPFTTTVWAILGGISGNKFNSFGVGSNNLINFFTQTNNQAPTTQGWYFAIGV